MHKIKNSLHSFGGRQVRLIWILYHVGIDLLDRAVKEGTILSLPVHFKYSLKELKCKIQRFCDLLWMRKCNQFKELLPKMKLLLQD